MAWDGEIKKNCSHSWVRNDFQSDGEDVRCFSECQRCGARQEEVFILVATYELDGEGKRVY